MMSMVNDGGGSTLVREELCGRPFFLNGKKVVVWEFVERDIGMGVKGWRRTPLPPRVCGRYDDGVTVRFAVLPNRRDELLAFGQLTSCCGT